MDDTTNSLREVIKVEIVKKVSSAWIMVIFLNIDNLRIIFSNKCSLICDMILILLT